MAWSSTGSVHDFLAEAGEFLRSDRVRNTVILTVTQTLRINGQAPADGPPARHKPLFGYWRPASGQHQVTGAFMHTPGFPVLLTFVSQQAAADLAGYLAASGRPVVGINAAGDCAQAFADAWRQHSADVAEVHRRNRLFRLGKLISPEPAPGGAARTPPAQRGRGYAAGVTVAVSQAAFDAGITDVLLYTDLANPTSNALYQRLGYRPIEDRLILSFGPVARS